MKSIKQIFNELATGEDFAQSAADCGITRAQYVGFLVEQALEDKHFLVESCVQHRLRFPVCLINAQSIRSSGGFGSMANSGKPSKSSLNPKRRGTHRR